MYKISFYVPLQDVERVKTAMFEAGAGRIGQYSHCSWQVLGEGQFMPLSDSNPSIGIHNQLEKVSEYKIEMICDDQHIQLVIAALKKSHPYETPAYHVVVCEDFSLYSIAKSDKIYALELSLLSAPTRQSIEHINALIADDFYEFGSSGRIWRKEDILQSLPQENALDFKINEFKLTKPESHVVLVTYKLTMNEKHSLRSSIWKYQQDRWQMIFHQGTACE